MSQPIDERTIRVFLVDDDHRLLRAARIALEAFLGGSRVETFSDPHDAFLASFAARPDAVVTDYAMPGCTGAQLARAMRKAHGEDCPPLLLVTGDVTLQRQERALFDAVYEKPLSPRHLAFHLRALRPGVRSGTMNAVTDPEGAATAKPRPTGEKGY